MADDGVMPDLIRGLIAALAALWNLLHLCRDRILEVCRILSWLKNSHFEPKSFRDRTLPWQRNLSRQNKIPELTRYLP